MFQSEEEQFKRQLDWCIEQLELGLRSQKATQKQSESDFNFNCIISFEKGRIEKLLYKLQLNVTLFFSAYQFRIRFGFHCYIEVSNFDELLLQRRRPHVPSKLYIALKLLWSRSDK